MHTAKTTATTRTMMHMIALLSMAAWLKQLADTCTVAEYQALLETIDMHAAFEQGYKDAKHPFGCPACPCSYSEEQRKAWQRGVDQFNSEQTD